MEAEADQAEEAGVVAVAVEGKQLQSLLELYSLLNIDINKNL